jgi:uncharacterized coiled-coil protein SlyX
MDENRLIDIETKLAALQATCKLLLERVQEVSEASGASDSQYEVPPHY